VLNVVLTKGPGVPDTPKTQFSELPWFKLGPKFGDRMQLPEPSVVHEPAVTEKVPANPSDAS